MPRRLLCVSREERTFLGTPHSGRILLRSDTREKAGFHLINFEATIYICVHELPCCLEFRKQNKLSNFVADVQLSHTIWISVTDLVKYKTLGWNFQNHLNIYYIIYIYHFSSIWNTFHQSLS